MCDMSEQSVTSLALMSSFLQLDMGRKEERENTAVMSCMSKYEFANNEANDNCSNKVHHWGEGANTGSHCWCRV
uniref:Uncharacterized protein n=1 Tax=Arion vulgaris TaxID=1028688 RepID=A0A0B7AJQ0_9EUPU